jgi:integrase
VQTDPLRTWGLTSKRTNTSLFSGLWEVAVDKGWASLNIAERLEEIKLLGREIKIYPNYDVRNLLASCLQNEATSSRVLVVLVLGLFGCMRPDEVLSKKALRNGDRPFTWEDINLERGLINVRREIAKAGDQRTIELLPMAVDWLKLAKELGNPLPPKNERRLRVQVAQQIGFDIQLEDSDWERDGLRKNCATHLRNHFQNDYKVVENMGNSVRILLKHYAALKTPALVSRAYWAITTDSMHEYMKTDAWKQLLLNAGSTQAAQLANGSAKP